MCVLMPTTHQLAFSVADFSGMSDIHERSGTVQSAFLAIDEKQAGYKSPHYCLMMLSIDLATVGII